MWHDSGSGHDTQPTECGPSVAVEFGGVVTSQAVELVFHWRVLGDFTLDTVGKPVFPPVPPGPGIYQITVDAEDASVYFGEATRLPARLEAL